MSSVIFCPMFNWVMFLLLSCKNSLHILDKRLLSETLFCFLRLAKTSNTLLNASDEIRHPYLLLNLRDKPFTPKVIPLIRSRKFPYI